MAIAFVQQATNIVAAGGAASTTLTVTAGSLLVVTFENISADADLTSVTDNRGNTWTRDRTRTSAAAGRRAAVYSAPNCASGSTTVTTNYPGGGAYRAQVTEFSGVATSSYVDVSGENTSDGDTSTPHPGLSIAAGSVAVMCATIDRTTNPTAGTGYTGLASSTDFVAAYKIFTGAGSGERGAFNSAPSQYDAVIVAYKEAVIPGLAGTITLDAFTLSGAMATGALSQLSSGFTLDAFALSGFLGLAPGRIDTNPFKNWTGTLLPGVTIPRLTFLKLSDMSTVLQLTNQVTAGDGVLTVTNAAFTPGTTYLVVAASADGAALGAEIYTAA